MLVVVGGYIGACYDGHWESKCVHLFSAHGFKRSDSTGAQITGSKKWSDITGGDGSTGDHSTGAQDTRRSDMTGMSAAYWYHRVSSRPEVSPPLNPPRMERKDARYISLVPLINQMPV